MTAYGWDSSHFDGPDTRGAIGQGFTFFTHKAGGDADDAELAAWWAFMKPYRVTVDDLPALMRDGYVPGKVLLGAYWVLYPGNPAGRADAFLTRLDSQCPGWRDGPFILQIDAEIWGGNTATKPSVDECNTFADRLVAKLPKLRPAGYLPKWVYGSAVSAFRYPLWASSYVSGTGPATALYPGDRSTHWDPYGGQIPAVLQFTSSATIAGQTTCDANAFRGTLAELVALVAPGWVDDMAANWTDRPWSADYTAAQALQGAYGYARDASARTVALAGIVSQMATVMNAVLANVTADDQEQSQLLADAQAKFDAVVADLHALPAELMAAIGDAEAPAAATADALRVVLGGRAREIGRLLAGD